MKWFMRVLSIVLCVMLLTGIIRVKYYEKQPLSFEGFLARITTAGDRMDNDTFRTDTNLLSTFQTLLSGLNNKVSDWLNQQYSDMINSGSIWDIVKYGFSWLVSLFPKIITGLVTVLKFIVDGCTALVNGVISLFRVILYVFFDI